MSQFTNPYNSQNGMSNNGPMDGSPPYPSGAWLPDVPENRGRMQQPAPASYRSNAQQSYPWEQQGWKPYIQESVKPFVGKWVNSFDEITPKDVPMNGQMAFFPQADNTCIYAMVWGNDGQIKPFRFIPELEAKPVTQELQPAQSNIPFDKFVNDVTDRLDAFESKLNDLLASLAASTAQTKTTSRSSKKEVDAT